MAEIKSISTTAPIERILGEKIETEQKFLLSCPPEKLPESFKRLTGLLGDYCAWKTIYSKYENEEETKTDKND